MKITQKQWEEIWERFNKWCDSKNDGDWDRQRKKIMIIVNKVLEEG